MTFRRVTHRRSRAARRAAERAGGGPDRRTRSRSSTCCRRPAFRSSRSRPSSARSGCRRWRTRAESSRHRAAARTCATRRSCPTSPGSNARDAAGVTEIAIFAAASETFSRQEHQSVDRRLARRLPRRLRASAAALGMRVRAYVSTAFGCPFEGHVPPERVAACLRSARRDGRVRGLRQRHDRHRASRTSARGAQRRRRHACRSRRSRCTFTTPAVPRLRTSSPRCRWA